MSSSIKDGKLVRASPSLISSFDATTPFGCERRGWFKYVAGKKEESTGNQSLGIELHRLNEAFLKYEETDSENLEALTLFYKGVDELLWNFKTLYGRCFKVEHPINTTLAGVDISGFCDFSSACCGDIYDWKTTSNIKKYGKTEDALKKDTQLLIYARALFPDFKAVRLAHAYYQTKGKPEFRVVQVQVSKEEIDREIDSVIIPKLERIKTVVAESDVTKLDRNEKACGLCPHKSYCPTKASQTIMSIFNKYSKPASQPAPQQAAIPEILPPDAPRSDPALAAEPSFVLEEANPRVLKKRGRPLGSGKKFSNAPAEGVVFESVTVSYGVTVNLGDYSSARVDVSMSARSADVEAAYAEVLEKVKTKVTEEVAVITSSMKGDKK